MLNMWFSEQSNKELAGPIMTGAFDASNVKTEVLGIIV
jgi:hypothetical protein